MGTSIEEKRVYKIKWVDEDTQYNTVQRCIHNLEDGEIVFENPYLPKPTAQELRDMYYEEDVNVLKIRNAENDIVMLQFIISV